MMRNAMPRSWTQVGAAAAVAAAALVLSGCASDVAAPRQYQLRSEPPQPLVTVPSTQVVQLMAPLLLPEALERDALMLPVGASGLQPWAGQRWAEPLRDALPRLLRQDLSALIGAQRVWDAQAPAAAAVTRQLRVEVLQFQIDAQRSGVRLQARWSLQDVADKLAPQVRISEIRAASAGGDADALVAAHRPALWRLAEEVAAALR